MTRRGMSLGTVLVVVALIAALGLALAGGVISHHTLLARGQQDLEALNLARSVASYGLERVVSHPEIGRSSASGQTASMVNSGALSPSLEIHLMGDKPGAGGLLTFDKDQASQLGIPPSFNNLENPRSELDARGQVVPANGVRLYGVGRVHGVERTVTITLVVPPFPWALAAGKNLTAENGLEIGKLPAMPTTWDPDVELLPADVAANGNVTLGAGTHIAGDVQAGGSIASLPGQEKGVVIDGERRPNSTPVEIPKLDLSKFDPDRTGVAATRITTPEVQWNTPLYGAFRGQGPVKVLGDLQLNGGLVFVDGDLEVTGSVRGKGIVVSTGKLKVSGSSQIQGTTSVAMLSGGSMSLQGTDKDRSQVAGLVYSGGDFEARSVSVLGTLVAQGQSSFRDARLVSIPGTTVVDPNPTSTPGSNSKWFMLTPQATLEFLPLEMAPGMGLAFNVQDSAQACVTRFTDPTTGATAYHLRIYAVPPGSAGVGAQSLPNTPLLFEKVFSSEAEFTNTTVGGLVMTNATYILNCARMTLPTATGEDLPPPPPSASDPGPPAPLPKLDLSEIFKLEDRIRLCQWKES